MLYLLIATAAAIQPTWVSSTTSDAKTVTDCFAGDAVAMGTFMMTQTDTANADSPTKMDAFGYCMAWVPQMAGAGNLVGNPMNQLASACALYHCLENFFGFTTEDIAKIECMAAISMTTFNGNDIGMPHANFPDSFGGSDTTNYASSSCVCNTQLAAAAPSPTYPEWLTMTGTLALCVDKVQWDPTNTPFFGCALRACMVDSDMKEYLTCTQDNYYGFEGLDECEKLDKLIIGNIAMPVPLALTGVVFFFLAMVMYGLVSVCCGSKKNSGGKIGV